MIKSNSITRMPVSIKPTRFIVRKPIIAPLRKHVSLVNLRDKVKISAMSIVDVSYYVGQSIILFTMFYCTLNWNYYRDLRKKQEQEDEDKKSK